MNILVINGSPKGEKSDTWVMTRAFLEGLEAEKHELTTIDIMKQHIEFCRGCFTCKKNGGHCVHDDDMVELLQQYIHSDLIVFSFPLYSLK